MEEGCLVYQNRFGKSIRSTEPIQIPSHPAREARAERDLVVVVANVSGDRGIVDHSVGPIKCEDEVWNQTCHGGRLDTGNGGEGYGVEPGGRHLQRVAVCGGGVCRRYDHVERNEKRVDKSGGGTYAWSQRKGVAGQSSEVPGLARPFSKEQGPPELEGNRLEPDNHLLVMGVVFKVGIGSKEALAPVFSKAKGRFWAMKRMVRSKTALPGRPKLMKKVLGVAAFYLDQQGLQAVNALQSQLVSRVMRLCKGQDEDWVSYRIRCFRAARYAIARYLPGRWSTAWLSRYWLYAAHRVRAGSWECPPRSAILTEYRSLSWWERLMGQERDMETAAGEKWRETTRDREIWKELLNKWVAHMDLPWSSHVQLAIEC